MTVFQISCILCAFFKMEKKSWDLLKQGGHCFTFPIQIATPGILDTSIIFNSWTGLRVSNSSWSLYLLPYQQEGHYHLNGLGFNDASFEYKPYRVLFLFDHSEFS